MSALRKSGMDEGEQSETHCLTAILSVLYLQDGRIYCVMNGAFRRQKVLDIAARVTE